MPSRCMRHRLRRTYQNHKGLLNLDIFALRGRMTGGAIRRVYWVSMSDMLADGLTKGSVDRTPLIDTAEKG